MKKPILFLIYKRPEPTEKVFKQIRKYQPAQLFVAADGPKTERDKILCDKTRDIIKKIDWDCKVKTLFRDKNLGCGRAVSSAIDWFFKNVKQGIILEDDCIPNMSFFTYCEDLLDRYQNNEKVMHIAGFSPLSEKEFSKMTSSYYFSIFNHCWGWATWRRAWKKFRFDLQEWPDEKNVLLNNYFKNKIDFTYWEEIFNRVKVNKIDTWAYRWTYTCWINGGLSVLPASNLVTNIGFDKNATHTKKGNSFPMPQVHSLSWPLKHPVIILRSRTLDDIEQRYLFDRSRYMRFRRMFNYYLSTSLHNLKIIFLKKI